MFLINNSSNLKIVRPRKARHCRTCNSIIQEGQQCLTINHKGFGRQWECLSCVETKLKLLRLQKLQKQVSNDADYYALGDYIQELSDSLD